MKRVERLLPPDRTQPSNARQVLYTRLIKVLMYDTCWASDAYLSSCPAWRAAASSLYADVGSGAAHSLTVQRPVDEVSKRDVNSKPFTGGCAQQQITKGQ